MKIYFFVRIEITAFDGGGERAKKKALLNPKRCKVGRVGSETIYFPPRPAYVHTGWCIYIFFLLCHLARDPPATQTLPTHQTEQPSVTLLRHWSDPQFLFPHDFSLLFFVKTCSPLKLHSELFLNAKQTRRKGHTTSARPPIFRHAGTKPRLFFWPRVASKSIAACPRFCNQQTVSNRRNEIVAQSTAAVRVFMICWFISIWITHGVANALQTANVV